MDEVVYRNSPIRYLGDMPADHPFIQLYNLKKAVICVGQGPWELPESTRQLDRILKAKKIDAWVDYWGYDCSHDLSLIHILFRRRRSWRQLSKNMFH